MSLEDSKFVEYFIKNGLLKTPEKCSCGHEVRLKNNDEKGMFYKCSRCKRTASVKEGSIFSSSKLPLKELVALTHRFISGTAVGEIEEICEVSKRSAVKWYQILRGLIKRYMEITQKPIGGPHCIVEADEVCLGHLTKVCLVPGGAPPPRTPPHVHSVLTLTL